MREFRARDDDRDRCVELIEAAHADGQVGDADRELRVARARSAQTLDELETLTRDLRRPAEAGVVGPGAPPLRTSLSPRRASRTSVWVGGVAVAVVGALALVPVGLLAAGGSDDSSSTVQEAPAVVVEAAAPFEMAPAQVRRFVRVYEREFETRDALEVVFSPSRVSVVAPTGATRPRVTRWSYDGTWRRDRATTAVPRSAEVVDLGALDVRRLFANIATAKKVLRVQQGELTHVVVRRRSGEAAVVSIYVGNTFNESGHLSTTPAGQVLRRVPYQS